MILVICTGRYFHSPLSRSVRFILLVLLYFGQPVDKNECINQVLHKINFDEQSPSILFVHGIITLHYEVNTTRLHLRTYSNALNKNWSKIPNANRETKTPHTKENETITPIKKDIQTPLLQSRLNTAAHHQRHIWKVEAQIPVLKSYFTSQGSWHTSES